MCGIAGIINHHADPAAGEIIAAMNECQIHRGPDGAGGVKVSTKGNNYLVLNVNTAAKTVSFML